MNKKIEAHVNTLFTNNLNGKYVSDIKEELLANLNDKYNDLITLGKDEDEAFAIVISGIGDINSLIKDLGDLPEYQPLEITKNQQKRGIFISIGIALYILSIIPVVLFMQIGVDLEFSTIPMLFICAIATGFVVFGNSVGKIKYSKTDSSFVEEYKEKLATDNNRIKLRNAITSSMWSLIIVIYLAFSFITRLWNISWVIFLIGACAQQFILYKFSESEKRRDIWHGILWTATVTIYFIISFSLSIWSWSWMIFLLAAAVEQIIRLLILWRKMV